MIVSTPAPLLHWDRLSVPLPTGADRPHAVENLSLDLRQNEVLCLVGESGSGKSVSAMATMGLLKGEMSQTSGAIRFAGQDLTKLSPDARRQLTGSKLSMVFQEPIASLNPFYTAGAQVSETIRTHSDQPAAAIREKVLSLFEEVHLPNPEQIFRAYPHELSGGQCQRVMIASALALDPAVLIADEPTTALDVTTQAQILSLILPLRDNHNTGILFITHDFGVVSEIADRVAVMRKGQLVEVGPREQILTNPQHDYTKALLAAVPKLAPRAARPVQGKPILEVNSVSKTYRTGSFLRKAGREVKAVVDANIHIHGGETLGVVGESGSGKTTLSQCIIRMVEPTSGQVQIAGKDFLSLKGKELRKATHCLFSASALLTLFFTKKFKLISNSFCFRIFPIFMLLSVSKIFCYTFRCWVVQNFCFNIFHCYSCNFLLCVSFPMFLIITKYDIINCFKNPIFKTNI